MSILERAKRIWTKRQPSPKAHTCPHCGAQLTRLTLVSGGIIRFGNLSRVKATIGCKDCHRTHLHRGVGVKDHWLVLQLQNQTRRYTHA